MARTRIPVLILAGFLGAGKTTLLNHLLTAERGARIGVLVNDFGSIAVDAMSVAGQVDSMLSLSNGCLCCAVDASGLDAMLARLSGPGSRLAVIVIEASGLAEPRELIRLMIASENTSIAYGGLVMLVDAAEFSDSRDRHPELADQLRFADLVLLTKIDRVTESARDALTGTLTQLVPDTPIVGTVHGRVDPALLFDHTAAADSPRGGQLSLDDLRAELSHDADQAADHAAGDCRGAEHAHAAYDTVEFSTERPMDPRNLLAFLESRPRGLYRMKGFVYFGAPGHRQRFTLHTVGGFLRFERSRWPAGEPRHTRLVLIGSGIEPADLRARLAACATDGEPPTDAGMLSILRYTET